MSRKQWLVVLVLALADVVVLGMMGLAVVRSFVYRPPTLVPPPVALLEPTATPPPTWTPTPSPTPQPSPTPRPMHTPTLTPAPWPTLTPTLPPKPAPVALENPTFDGVLVNFVPGWKTGGFANWTPGADFDAVNSYAAPRFHQADDPRQWINGPTLQIDTEPWVKLRAWIFQTVEVKPGGRAQFQIHAVGFVKNAVGGYVLKAGVDPDGGEGCDAARWGAEQIANQEDGAILLGAPEVVVGQAGKVTVCAFAETQFAQVYHAAFFDDASITVR